MKRSFRLPAFFVAAWLFFAAFALPAFAEGGVALSASSAEGTVGGEARVSLRVEKNAGVRSLSFALGYDPAVLSPVRAEYGADFGDDYATPIVLSGEGSILFNRVFTKENKTVGVFAEVTFRILSAPAGETALTLARRGEKGWTVLSNGAEAEMTFNNGKITVRPAETTSAAPLETQSPQTAAPDTAAPDTTVPAGTPGESGTAAPATGPAETAPAPGRAERRPPPPRPRRGAGPPPFPAERRRPPAGSFRSSPSPPRSLPSCCSSSCKRRKRNKRKKEKICAAIP